MSYLAYEMYYERELAKARSNKKHFKCLCYLVKLYFVRKKINKGKGW